MTRAKSSSLPIPIPPKDKTGLAWIRSILEQEADRGDYHYEDARFNGIHIYEKLCDALDGLDPGQTHSV